MKAAALRDEINTGGVTTTTMQEIVSSPALQELVKDAELPDVPAADSVLPDVVNHPPHYTRGKYEVIDVIHDWELGFDLGNAIKYIARAGHKNSDKEVEDLEKAVFYINDKIKRIQG